MIPIAFRSVATYGAICIVILQVAQADEQTRTRSSNRLKAELIESYAAGAGEFATLPDDEAEFVMGGIEVATAATLDDDLLPSFEIPTDLPVEACNLVEDSVRTFAECHAQIESLQLSAETLRFAERQSVDAKVRLYVHRVRAELVGDDAAVQAVDDQITLVEDTLDSLESVIAENRAQLDTSIVIAQEAADTAAATVDAHNSDIAHAPYVGSHIIVQLADDAFLETVADLKQKYGVELVDVIPEFLSIIVRDEKPEPWKRTALTLEVDTLVERIRHDPCVKQAIPNLALGPHVKTRACQTVGKDKAGQQYHYSWDVADAAMGDGTLPYRLINLPQAWNFNDAITGMRNKTRVAVIDQEFSYHNDCASLVTASKNPTKYWHGNHVLGLIGAEYDNLEGIDGISPFADVVPIALDPYPERIPDDKDQAFAKIDQLMIALGKALRQRFSVISVSLGYNWGELKDVRRESPKIAQRVRAAGEIFYDRLHDYPETIIVSSAGNDSTSANPVHARWGSPMNWAAFHDDERRLGPPNVVVVESVTSTRARSDSSNPGGMIGAPGEAVLSLDSVPEEYVVASGTSQAAPQVAAVIASMLALNPDLTPAEILSRLPIRRDPNDPLPILDAFGALLRTADGWPSLVANVNKEGGVDLDDVKMFAAELAEVKKNPSRAQLSRFDLNGSGTFTDEAADRVQVLNVSVTDAEVLLMALPKELHPEARQILERGGK